MRNHLEESNKRPLAVAQNEVIEVGQRLSALKSEESPNSKKIKKLEKEIFYKALELGSFPVETEFERSQAESNMKQDLRRAIQEKHGIRVNSISFSMPSRNAIRRSSVYGSPHSISGLGFRPAASKKYSNEPFAYSEVVPTRIMSSSVFMVSRLT